VIAAPGVVDANPDRHVLEEVGIAIEGRRIRRQVEDQLVLALLQLARQEGSDSAIGIGRLLTHELWLAIFLQSEKRDRQAGGGSPHFQVKDVGRDGRTVICHCYPPHMANLTIRVGDLHFTARWETDAPRTVEAVRRLLPIRSKLIHCRWSGDGTWIPFGDLDVGVGYENHTSHPAPGELLIYTGDLSECEILFPYGACMFSSKLGQLSGNHFATVVSGAKQLREMGRRVLWEGAQEITITEREA